MRNPFKKNLDPSYVPVKFNAYDLAFISKVCKKGAQLSDISKADRLACAEILYKLNKVGVK